MNIVIITAKGGNKSIENKNVIPINGKPSIAWSIEAAQNAKTISRVFVSTEDKLIANVAKKYNAEVLERPFVLSQPFSNHGDVIMYAANQASKLVSEQIQTVTILLGNTVMTKAVDIDKAVEKTLSTEEIDSCMTVWKAQDDHPKRALSIDDNGYLKSYLNGETPDTNRQSYQDVYFYDQGPWTVRMSSLQRSKTTKEGPGPWWWMGKNCIPIERIWVTGRDIHSQFDIGIAEWWLVNYCRNEK